MEANRRIPLPYRILIAENYEDSAFVMNLILARRGYQVTIARTMFEARKFAATQEFDLLISDILFPDGTGLDLIREFKARYPIKSIALTGLAMASDVRMQLDAGFDRHIRKPFHVKALLQTIEELMKSKLRNAALYAGLVWCFI
jgi:two-component system response regulator CpxR